MIIIIKYTIYDISILYNMLGWVEISRMDKAYDQWSVVHNMYFIITKVY